MTPEENYKKKVKEIIKEFLNAPEGTYLVELVAKRIQEIQFDNYTGKQNRRTTTK